MVNYNDPEEPARVWHAKVLRIQGQDTQERVNEILSLLNPTEESPVLDFLQRIEAKVDCLLTILLPPTGEVAER